jgi:hypothetical protein
MSTPFACEICGSSPAAFSWSDLHGEGMCCTCGTPYQIIHYEGEAPERRRADLPPRINLRPGWAAVCKQYWDETKAYMGLGSIMIMGDYPQCERGRRAFNVWLDAHPEVIPPQEDAA